MKQLFFIASIITLLFLGCKKNYLVEDLQKISEKKYEENKSEFIFDQETLHTFSLTLPEASLAAIDADPTAEQYVEGSLSFNGETISPVGIRYKGSIGAFLGGVSGEDWVNPSGHKTATKLSMKVKINWEDPDKKFYGLKKLQFHSQNLDPTQLHDRLAYSLFREMGVVAPRAVHARLVINGVYSGLYMLIEQIDKRFLKQNYTDSEGNLYKEVWPLTENGGPQDEQLLLASLKTNKNSGSASIITNFADAISTATDTTTIRSVLEKYLNMKKVMSYIVVDRTIKNDDGIFHWYRNESASAPHNFFWYEEPSSEKVHLIPWDMDLTFENINNAGNPITVLKNDWDQTSDNCNAFYYSNGFQKAAACDKIIGSWAIYQEEFAARKSEFISGPFSATNTDKLIDSWTNQIRNATKEASENHDDAISLTEWDAAVQTLKKRLEYARNN